jgi:hypothetical protein
MLLQMLLLMLSLLLKLSGVAWTVRVVCDDCVDRCIVNAIVDCCCCCCWLYCPCQQLLGSICLHTTCRNDAIEHIAQHEDITHRTLRAPIALEHGGNGTADKSDAARREKKAQPGVRRVL